MGNLAQELQQTKKGGFSFPSGAMMDDKAKLLSALKGRDIDVHWAAENRIKDPSFASSRPGKQIRLEFHPAGIGAFKAAKGQTFAAVRDMALEKKHASMPEHIGLEAIAAGCEMKPGAQIVFLSEGDKVFVLDREEGSRPKLYYISADNRCCGECIFVTMNGKMQT